MIDDGYWKARMARKALGTLEYQMALVVKHHQPAANPLKVYRELTAAGRHIALSGVYAGLEQMEGKGWLTSCLGEGEAADGRKRPMRYYQLTDEGWARTCETHNVSAKLAAPVATLLGPITSALRGVDAHH